MSFSNPANHIDRVSIKGEEAEYIKMFDPRPVGDSPPLPERLLPTNPVPEVMGALGFGDPAVPRTMDLDLMSGLTVNTWDGGAGGSLDFFVFRDKNHDGTPRYPGNTIRMPRGVIMHCDTNGKGPPPHTIHWHGLEPTPMNDGVGHTSMEIGSYTYQLQPNFMGAYFYHCHRNTMQHFEFGLFGNLFVMAPDAYFASINGADWRTQTIPNGPITLNNIPVGASEDGKFRVACNLDPLPADVRNKFPDFVRGDKTFGVAGANDVGVGDARAYTVPYDVEAMWVLDDRDSNWSTNANGARDTFPIYDANAVPGVLPDDPNVQEAIVADVGENVDFNANVPASGFFAFNDFRADYWFISGAPVPAARGGDAEINSGLTQIPPLQNSGVSGTQIEIDATVGQVVLVRCLDAAYNSALITFPFDVVIIAWDGRALGVPPFGLYNEPFVVKKGTPIFTTTARRFDAIFLAEKAMIDHATVTFHDTRGGERLVTARIPIRIRG